jgi:CBS domain-containing protein
MSLALETGRPRVVADIMSRPVLTVEITETLWDAWQLLFVSGLRHLVVLNADGSALGVLSDRNVLAEVPATVEHLSRRHVADVLAQVPLVYVHPGDSPIHAADVMTANMVEAVPVVDDDGRLIGIVTEFDIVRWVVAPQA